MAKGNTSSTNSSSELDDLDKQILKLKKQKRIAELEKEIAELKNAASDPPAKKNSRKRNNINEDNDEAKAPPAKKRKENSPFVSVVLNKESEALFPPNAPVIPKIDYQKSGSIFPPNSLMVTKLEGRKVLIYQAEADDNQTCQITGQVYCCHLEEAMNEYKEESLINVESVLLNVKTNEFRTDPAIVAAAKGNGPGILPKDFSQISKGIVVTGIQGIKGFVRFLDGMHGAIPKSQIAYEDFGTVISCEVIDFDADAKSMKLLSLRCKLPIAPKVGDVVDGVVVGKFFNALGIHIMSDKNDKDTTVNGIILASEAKPSKIEFEPNVSYTKDKILPYHPFSTENGIKVGQVLKNLTVLRVNESNHIVNLTNNEAHVPVDKMKEGDVISCFIKHVRKSGLKVVINPMINGFIRKDEIDKECDLEEHYAPGTFCKAVVTDTSFRNGKKVLKLSIRELPK